MPFWTKLMFQESLSFEMEGILFFHDFSMTLVIFISFFSGYFIFRSLFNSSFDSYLSESQEMEVIWTVLPVFLLVALVVPSIKVLYMCEEPFDFYQTVKIIGHQWFWSYDSPLTEETEIFLEQSGILRLLKTSSVLSLPAFCPTRGLVTSADVIHSWSLPSMGVKIDAVPGRLNQNMMHPYTSGVAVGQCSEICGANHSFMPIISIFS